jgi:hypothetical protein
MNFFTHFWVGSIDLPKTANGFSYGLSHVKLLAKRIGAALSDEKHNLYVYTNVDSIPKRLVIKNVNIIRIPLPKSFFDFGRCYGRLLSFKDSKKYVDSGSRIFIDLDMVPGPNFIEIKNYKNAFLRQKMVETNKYQINGGLLVVSGGFLDGLSEEFLKNPKKIIDKYSGEYVGSDQAVISGYLEVHNFNYDFIENVVLLKKLKFRFFLPKEIMLVACSGKRTPFSFRSRIVYPFLNYI